MSGKTNDLVATPDMCRYCFHVLICELLRESKHEGKELTALSSEIHELRSKIPTAMICPLFVTWDMKSSHDDYDLRGCIGTLSSQKICTALGEYVFSSAFRDRRFHPITIDEVPYLRVAVSLLVNYEDCNNCLDWEVGVHGIIIKFHKEIDFSATYLPEVASQQQWSQKKTVESLVRKTGYSGKIDEELLATICCKRYQSSKQRLMYEEYTSMVGYDPIQATNAKKKNSSSWKKYFG